MILTLEKKSLILSVCSHLVHLEQLVVGELGVVGVVDDVALPVHHPVHGDAVVGVGQEEVHALGVGSLGAGEVGRVGRVVVYELQYQQHVQGDPSGGEPGLG